VDSILSSSPAPYLPERKVISFKAVTRINGLSLPPFLILFVYALLGLTLRNDHIMMFTFEVTMLKDIVPNRGQSSCACELIKADFIGKHTIAQSLLLRHSG
jgi:ABC-type microcin C transport system permease subunit YejE